MLFFLDCINGPGGRQNGCFLANRTVQNIEKKDTKLIGFPIMIDFFVVISKLITQNFYEFS